MSAVSSFIGAFILTYALSRVLLRVLVRFDPRPRLLIAHGLSLALLVLWVGLLKAYFDNFAQHETLVFFAPQAIWFGVDWLRGKTLAR